MNIYFQGSNQRSFGTFPLKGDVVRAAVHDALAVGYRCFDTAQMYGNEAEVGEALAQSEIPRSELCITTKVHPENFGEARFLPSVEASLKALRIDRADVLLLHWPPLGEDVVPSLRLLEKAQQLGLARHIGVSNYTAAMMRTARDTLEGPIVVNQVEFHPLLDQSRLMDASVETGIPLSSYCSVARGEVFKHALFDELAEQYGRTPAQIVLRWILQQGVPITTMSTKRSNIAANFNVADFILSPIDMAAIDRKRSANYRIVDRSLVPWAPEWD